MQKQKTTEGPAFLYCGQDTKPFLAFAGPITNVNIVSDHLTRKHPSTKDILGEELIVLGIEQANHRGVATSETNIGDFTVMLVALKKDAGLTRTLALQTLWKEDGSIMKAVREALPARCENAA